MNRVSKTEVFEKYNSTHLQLKQSKNYQKQREQQRKRMHTKIKLISMYLMLAVV